MLSGDRVSSSGHFPIPQLNQSINRSANFINQKIPQSPQESIWIHLTPRVDHHNKVRTLTEGKASSELKPLGEEPTKGQHPSKSLKAMGISRPAASTREATSTAEPSPAQAKTVELIQTEHQYSLSEPMDGTFILPDPVLGSEREQDAAQRRLSYYQQELWSMLERLREQHLLQEDTERMLKSQFGDLQLSLQCEGVQCENYPADTRNFAVSLHLFSAKAYDFMKRTFQLPEPSALRRWLSNPDFKPGLSQQAFDTLAERSKADDQAFKMCSLLIGTMPLERKIHFDPSTRTLQGLVDFGAGKYDADEVLGAAEALLLVAVGFQGQWIVPLGYFLLPTLRGDTQAQLLRHCILKLYDIGVQVISVTSDATCPNIDTARQLGVLVDGVTVKSTFFHPATPTLEIAYYFDPSHLLTLIHNLLQASGTLQGVSTGSALMFVESKRGKHLPAKSVQRVIRSAKQIVGLPSQFFGDSSHHWCLAQELAILADKLPLGASPPVSSSDDITLVSLQQRIFADFGTAGKKNKEVHMYQDTAVQLMLKGALPWKSHLIEKGLRNRYFPASPLESRMLHCGSWEGGGTDEG
ncbi:DNA transposase THAP9 [Varanus komodoensis]|nr:DNA transposase THAP9 [Varanus komodoensis]